MEIFLPQLGHPTLEVTYDWQSENPGKATRALPARDLGNAKLELLIGFDNRKAPGVGDKLRFVASPWNGWNR